MELQFEKQELSCLAQALRAVKDQELTQEIRLTEGMPDVGRVLAGWGQVILRSKEWQGSRIGASGGVQATVLYAPEDGSEPRVINGWIPFQIKWDGPQTDREGPMRMMPLLRFVDGRNVSARKILVRAGISCLAEAMYQHHAEVFRPTEVPEDVELLRRSYPMRLPREAGEKAFEMEEELNAGAEPVEEILSYTLRPEVSEHRINGDKVVIRGVGNLHLVYRCPEGRIRTRNFELPFSQLGELEKAYENDAQADVVMAVTGLELDHAGENLAVKCSMVAQYLISDRTLLELTEDAYSPCREVGLRQQELILPVILDETRERISAQADFPELNLDGVDLTFWPGFPQQRREGETVELEVPGRFQLLGYQPDGHLRAASARWDGKIALGADDGSRIDPVTRPMGEPQWITAVSGMEARAEAEVQTTTVSRREMPMITSLELGPMREADEHRPSLILCRPGKRGLWSLAKSCGSSVDAIHKANGLDDDPQDDRILLIPVS